MVWAAMEEWAVNRPEGSVLAEDHRQTLGDFRQVISFVLQPAVKMSFGSATRCTHLCRCIILPEDYNG